MEKGQDAPTYYDLVMNMIQLIKDQRKLSTEAGKQGAQFGDEALFDIIGNAARAGSLRSSKDPGPEPSWMDPKLRGLNPFRPKSTTQEICPIRTTAQAMHLELSDKEINTIKQAIKRELEKLNVNQDVSVET